MMRTVMGHQYCKRTSNGLGGGAVWLFIKEPSDTVGRRKDS